MATTVILPKQGNTVESCIIVEWKKDLGDAVAVGDALMEVETDKATMDVESTEEGVLLARLVGEGDDVPVLAPIAVIGAAGEKVETPAANTSDTRPPTEAAPPADAPAASPAPPTAAPAKTPAGGEAARTRSGRIAISPRARRLAEQKNVDYVGIAGSGPGGRIMVRDIESALKTGAASPAAPAVTAAAAETPVQETKVTGIRRIIADRMRASLAGTAQLTMNAGADARRLKDYRTGLKASGNEDLESISLNDLVLFAVSRTLARYQEINATFSDGVIRQYGAVNLGFAVDTDRGLMVPVIRNAASLSLSQLAAEAHRLAAACKDSKARPEDLSDATFTVTNLGIYGVRSFTPVLNPPQVGILGVGNIELEPVEENGAVTFVPTLGLSLTIDHQVVDGAPGARFLAACAEAITRIDLTLAQ